MYTKVCLPRPYSVETSYSSPPPNICEKCESMNFNVLPSYDQVMATMVESGYASLLTLGQLKIHMLIDLSFNITFRFDCPEH